MENEDAILLRKEIGELSDDLKKAINKLGEGDRYDKELGKGIKESFEKLTTAITKFKAIDLTPVINIANDISKQNVSILAFLEVLKKTDTNIQITQLLTESIKRSNEFVERGLKQIDYSGQFKEIIEILNKEYKIITIQRDAVGRAESLTPIYKK